MAEIEDHLSGEQPRKSSRYSRTEKLLLVLGIQIIAIMMYSFFLDIPLSEIFSMTKDDRRLPVSVGAVNDVEGRVTRKRAAEFEFKPLLENQPVYANDTILTGPESTAVIVLNNSRKIRITASSMIRLAFGTDLTGISVDVLNNTLDEDARRVVPLKGEIELPRER